MTDLWTCNRPCNPKNPFTIDKILTKSNFLINVNVVRFRDFSGSVYAHFPPLIIWEKALFFFEQLFPVVARTWLGLKSDRLFLGPKFRFLAQKSDFCHTTPIFVDDPFLALDMTVNFPPWKRFFDFPFRSYSCFRKKIRLTRQKVFPPPPCGSSVCQ